MLRFFYSVSIIVFIFTLSGCNNKFERRIFPTIEVLYSEESNVTEVSATFRENDAFGEKTALSDNSSLKIGNKLMKFDPNINRYYLRIVGKPTKLEIVWEDLNGDIYVNDTELTNEFSLDSMDNDTIVSTKSNHVSWKGDPLQQTETAYVRVHGKIFTQTKVGKNYFRFLPDDLKHIPKGNSILLSPERIKLAKLVSASKAYGTLRLIYRAKSKPVYLR